MFCLAQSFFFLLVFEWMVLRESVVRLSRQSNTETPSVLVLGSQSRSHLIHFLLLPRLLSPPPVNLAGLRRSSLSHAKTKETSSATSRGSELHHGVDVRERTHVVFCFFFSPHGDVSRSSQEHETCSGVGQWGGGGGQLSLFVALYTQTSFLLDLFSH